MHILVTDRLACPRCGPGFGLILLATEIEARRVLEGELSCANCRERYLVAQGFGDLRPQPRESQKVGEPLDEANPEVALRLAALLGVSEGPGLLLVFGPSAGQADRLSRMIEGIEIVAVHPQLRDGPEESGVSRIALAGGFPFLGGSLRGVVLDGGPGIGFLGEAIRALAPGSRLVFIQPPEGAAEQMETRELDLLMEADTVLVGVRK